MTDQQREMVITEQFNGLRFDQAAAQLFFEYSRARLTNWIRLGALTLDGHPAKPKETVFAGMVLRLNEAVEQETLTTAVAQPLLLALIHEDDALLVINKDAGVVVHPAAGHVDGTLLNALLHHHPPLAKLPRAGIVHRLDKDTSGLLVVAKTLQAHHALVKQLQARTVSREYLCVVNGALTSGGSVSQPIGRHPQMRQRMAVVGHGKEAISHYRIDERFRSHTAVKVFLETGRTHQIRVHMAFLGYPLVGDPVYGGRRRVPKGASSQLLEMLQQFPRQALHAHRLKLVHPITGEECQWESQEPNDMMLLKSALRLDTKAFHDEANHG